MIGYLPKSVEINGNTWAMNTDYRNILTIFEAMEDDSLSSSEKMYVLLTRMYVDFEKMPKNDYKEAVRHATEFMESHDRSDDKKNPRIVDWQKDEHMIFPAINAVAGCEVRAVEYMHWWTFLGYFENIDNECLWSFVLSIRQKRARGKKLEKYEQDFYNRNRDLCSINRKVSKRKAEDSLTDMFEMLAEGGNKDG